MKAKLKSANGFTRFMLAHGEKLGLAAVLAVAGLLINASLGRERLAEDKHPPQLEAEANSAEQHFMQMSWEKFPPDQRVDVGKLASVPSDGGMKAVKPEDFPIMAALDPRVTTPVGLRTDPELLPPLELEVNAGSGLWAFDDPNLIRRRALDAAKRQQKVQREEERQRREEEEDERRGRGRGRGWDGGGFERGGFGRGGYGGGGLEMTEDNVAIMRPSTGGQMEGGFADIRTTSWATVVGKVPIKQQAEKYEESLRNSRGFDESFDMPRYIGYEVERAEVTDQGQGDWKPLPPVHKAVIIEKMEERPIEPPEVADEKYVHPLLTYPLPPMVLRMWDDEVTHSDMPPPSPDDMYRAEEKELADAERKKPDKEEGGDVFSSQIKREQAPLERSGDYSGRGGIDQGYAGRGGGYGGDFGRGGPDMMMGRGGFDMGGRGGGYGMGRGAGGYENLPEKTWDRKTKWYLFRFFDDTVKPGKRYRYRVRLAVEDVNSDRPDRVIPPRFLDPAVLARKAKDAKKYRFSEWSETSATASVPQPGLMYLAKVNPANPGSFSTEPDAEVLIKSLDAENVAEVSRIGKFTRGSVLNVVEERADVITSPTYGTDDEEEEDGPRQSPRFDFITGLTLLDFAGGDTLEGNRELLGPARALVMDGTGRMRVENELTNLKPVRQYRLVMEMKQEQTRERQDDDRGGDRGRRGRGRR